MMKLVYSVSQESVPEELEWLRDQMIFPAIQPTYDMETNRFYTRLGVIVGKEAALIIKLRHKLDLQAPWKQC